MNTQAERIASLEARIKQAERLTALEGRMNNIEKVTESMDKKLDDLLELRNKGAGMFLIISGLVGTGVMGLIYTLIQWLRS